MSVILCYGDSNTHGTPPMDHLGTNERHKWNERWPNVMANTLGPKYNVIDEGLPGRTTVHDDNVEGGMRNGMTVLPAILHSHKPIDLMLIMLGTNDHGPIINPGYANYSILIQKLSDFPPFGEQMPLNQPPLDESIISLNLVEFSEYIFDKKSSSLFK